MQGGERILTSQETERYFNAQRLLDSSAYFGMESVASVSQIEAYAAPMPVPVPAQLLPYVVEPHRGESMQITVAPVYNISGSAAPEELQEILRQHDEDLTERIKEVVSDLQIERGRRTFV